jgi:acetolactate decarboxylase
MKLRSSFFRRLLAGLLGGVLLFPVLAEPRDAATGNATPAAGDAAAARDVIFQLSTIDALLAGVYDPCGTVGELRRHGDTAIGTFEALDGEMIGLDGVIYQARADGTVRVMPDAAGVPFAVVTWFDTDRRLGPLAAASLDELNRLADAALPTPNLFYTVRLDGVFARVKARSVPRQNQPYPPLAVAAKQQAVFEWRDVAGTLIGFRCPPYVKGVNVPGWHWHFLAADKSRGGHVLDLTFSGLTARLDGAAAFTMRLPETAAAFDTANLATDRAADLHRVESAPQLK